MKTKAKPEKKAHARFSPSAAHRWMHCGASITFIEDNNIPNVSSSYADEGTVAHAVHEACLKEGKAPDAFKGKTINGIKVDTDMVKHVEFSVDIIREAAKGCELIVEGDIPIKVIGDDGHPDAIVIDSLVGELHVYDFKYGKGHAVEVDNNEQMMLYAVGALERTHQAGKLLGIDKVYLHITQPRAPHDDGPHRTWMTTALALAAYSYRVGQQIAAINARTAPFAPSVDACRFCPAKGSCPALAAEAVKAANSDFAEFMDEPMAKPDIVKKVKATYPKVVKGLNDKDLGRVMDRLALLFLWANAIELEVGRRIAAKRTVPGWKMVEGKSNRRWRDEPTVMRTLARLGLSADDYYPRALVGVGTVEALLGAKAEKVMPKLTDKPPGKPTLARSDDKRPALNYTTAADDFAAHIDAEE